MERSTVHYCALRIHLRMLGSIVFQLLDKTQIILVVKIQQEQLLASTRLEYMTNTKT